MASFASQVVPLAELDARQIPRAEPARNLIAADLLFVASPGVRTSFLPLQEFRCLTTHLAQVLPRSPRRFRGSPRPSDRASLLPSPSKTKKNACRSACALSLNSATDWVNRFRQGWCALSCSPTIAPIKAPASLESLEKVGRSTSVLSKPRCFRDPRTPATLGEPRWILPRLGLKNEMRQAASS